MELLLATRNAHKTHEVRELLGAHFNVEDLSSYPEINVAKETGETFAENATLKALSVSQSTENLVIADDSGLEVDALDGAPGVFSARYAGENATDDGNIEKLLSELRGKKTASETRAARFRCVIALARDGKLLGSFEGSVEGRIIEPPRGESGFGYDPVFQPLGFEKTFAEMPSELKNKISHRGKAIALLREALQRLKI